MPFDPVPPQERIVLDLLQEANSWTPTTVLLRRFKIRVGIGNSRTVGVTNLLSTLLARLIPKAYVKKEMRGTIEGWQLTPRGRSFLEQ